MVMPTFDKIAFVASETEEAQAALAKLTKRYGRRRPSRPTSSSRSGGDGLMLQTMHRHLNNRIPIYGMNRGSVGFLLNDYRENELERAAEDGRDHRHPSPAHDRP